MLRRTTGIAAGAGIAVFASGCGLVPGLGQTPVEIVSNMAEQTAEVDSYTATMSFSEGGVGDMEMEYTAEPEPTIKMLTEYQGTESTMLMRGDEMLMEAGSGMGEMAPSSGPEWLRVGESDGLGSEMDLEAQNPAAEVEMMLAAEDVTEEGSETVEGTETTKYSGSYTVEEALAELEEGDLKDASKQYYEENNIDSIDFEVWIDDDGFPRKVNSTDGSSFDTSMTFDEFNQGVEIDYPSEDEIGSMEDMMGGLETPSY
ncbi:hypothetical protein FHX37_3051 [Haloactinospora alba]|uniref:Lipoprotein n=1 Tax=Haloactinospora alba TaxID=405555 RepID=A0A543NMN1_9ACTN|nr:hypothetical protein [Haloactinospora alba]TQN33057.1 hypothetical protein FHX37_3051 [Haloactinospora alba]